MDIMRDIANRIMDFMWLMRPIMFPFAALGLFLLFFWLLFAGCSTPLEKKCQPKPARSVKVLVFVADGCDACIKAKSTILRRGPIDVDVEIADIHKNPQLAKKYNITSVPTFIVNVNGEVIKTQDVFVAIHAMGGFRCD